MQPTGYFAKLVSNAPAAARLLPLSHSTDGWHFRKIKDAAQLEARETCKVFNERLVYFFYGRPAYIPRFKRRPPVLASSAIVCFVLRPDNLPSPKRILPFDTGAMHGGLMELYLHPDMGISDFTVNSEINEARKIVCLFYGDNRRYYNGYPLEKLKHGVLDMEAEAYMLMIRSRVADELDLRRKSIEVQFDSAVRLEKGAVFAIVVPLVYGDDPVVLEFATELGTDLLYYDAHDAGPEVCVHKIMAVLGEHLREKGFFDA